MQNEVPTASEHADGDVAALSGLWRFDGGGGMEAECRSMLLAQPAFVGGEARTTSLAPVVLGCRSLGGHPGAAAPAQSGPCTVVADARLDNRSELGDDLGLSRGRLGLASDALLLALAWQRWGKECCSRLLGDFAFAVWDEERRTLALVRDPGGARPLHYHQGARLFAFASLARGLHALPEIARAPDLAFIRDALGRGTPRAGGFWYEGIARVRPGHLVEASADGVREERWWKPSPAPLRLGGPQDYADALLAHLDEGVARRIGAASTVAAHLSGGLDSSAVAASAALRVGPQGRVVAFTAVPRPGYACGDRLVDEGPLAAAVAARYPNIDHVLVRADGRAAVRDLALWHDLLDQPVPNPCNMPWIRRVAEEASQRGFSSIVTGQYGNFGFSYDGLPWLPFLLRRGRFVALAREALALRKSGARSLRETAGIATWPLRARWRARRAHADPGPLPADTVDFRVGYFASVDLGAFWRGVYAATGVQHRDALSDRRLVEFTLAVPDAEFLRGGVPRALARRALARRLPAALLAENRRGVQAADWHEGAFAARDAMTEEIAAIAACAPAAEALDVESMRRRLAAWPADGWERPDVSIAYRAGLLRQLSIGHFIRRACGA